MSKKNLKTKAVTYILLSLSLLIILLLIELGLSLFYPQETMKRIYENTPQILQASSVLPYTLKPNSSGRFRTAEFDTWVSINSHGYRGKDFNLQKGNKHRILAIGDSFTAGHGVNDNETYASRLDELLGNDVEVINGGYVSGYSPDTYYLYLKTSGFNLQPDIILAGLFIGNDIDHPLIGENIWVKVDNNGLPLKIINAYSTVENGYYVADIKRFQYTLPVLRNSHLFQFIMSRAQLLMPSLRNTSPVNLLIKQNSEALLHVYYPEYLARTQELLDGTEKLLLAMNTLAKKHGSILIPIMIPELIQIDHNAIPDFVSLPDGLDFDKPQRVLSKFFQENNIAFIDLLPVMREHADMRLYFPKDRHWTPEGHRLASEAIAGFLRKNKHFKELCEKHGANK